MMKFTFGIDHSSTALFLGTKDCGIQWTNDGIYRWVAGERKEIDFEGFVLDPASYSVATFDLQPAVQCKDCKFYMAEMEERCNALKSEPFGLCLRERQLSEADYREQRNWNDFCSRGKRRESDG